MLKSYLNCVTRLVLLLIVSESPAVGLREQNFVNETPEHHLEVMSELIQRDKNKPSVVMWSVANELDSLSEKAQSYFEAVAKKT